MPFTLTMPKLSPTMEEGTIVKWHKKEGENVLPGDLLFEVTTDKATVEHAALDEGWLRRILIEEGQEARVNQPVAVMSESKEESIVDYRPEVSAETLTEPGSDRPAPEAASKAVPASDPHPVRSEGERIPNRSRFTPAPPLENYRFEYPSENAAERVIASPLAKKIAVQKGLDLRSVQGTGPRGRIVAEDLEKAQPIGPVSFGRREMPTLPPGSYEESKLSPVRKVIAERLQEAKSFVPHFYLNLTIDAEPLYNLREQLISREMKFSINDFIVRACALSLRKHPDINSGFNGVNQSIVRFKTIDISIAVTVDEGLLTPVVRHADYKNLGELSVEIRRLARKAREGKLDLQEFTGGSFTISNLGMYGITDFQAIVNPPQAAILSVGAVQDVPVVREGKVVAGKTLNLGLSVDHRVVDGVAAAQFLQTVKKYLESPAVLLV